MSKMKTIPPIGLAILMSILIMKVSSLSDPCNTVPRACGLNAICTAKNGNASCSCPAKNVGDPKIRCCIPLVCSCSGDALCTSFDGAMSNFQGQCKYDTITTDCGKKELPANLVAFNVRQKHQRSLLTNATTSSIRYIEINIFGTQYRLLRKTLGTYSNAIPFTVNGVLRYAPYSRPLFYKSINIYQSGNNLVFSVSLGITITWDGMGISSQTICDTYANNVCGLCGNADGDSKNDFVDRKNAPVDVISNSFKWASNWRVLDDAVDTDRDQCDLNKEETASPTLPTCSTSLDKYKSDNYCGLLTSATGPFKDCISKLDSKWLEGLLNACQNSLCVLEGKGSQDAIRCATYASLADTCYNYAARNEVSLNLFGWRDATNCPAVCKANQVYELRAECPKTCLKPKIPYDCGIIYPKENCYCKPGFLETPSGECIKSDSCGCMLSDRSAYIMIGQVLTSLDCTKLYSCQANNSLVTTKLDKCSSNATCSVDKNNNPVCECRPGYFGNGKECNKENICNNNPSPCGVGAICKNQDGKAVCSCPADKNGDPKVRCGSADMTCGCWGDPHCRTFDRDSFTFSGSCKYDVITTDCFNKILPSTLVSFNVRQKQEPRLNLIDGNVAFVRYIEINVFGIQYRLLKSEAADIPFTINGIKRNAPYVDNSYGINIDKNGGRLLFTSDFGLSVEWDGSNSVSYSLSDIYKSLVCGLCGNGDGEKSNDYVDRANKPVDNKFHWGQSWRVFDDSFDADQSICHPDGVIGDELKAPSCVSSAVYEDKSYCGILNNTDLDGIFHSCIKNFDSAYIELLKQSCIFDMCAAEKNVILQNSLKCNHIESLAEQCVEYATKLNKSILASFEGWRIITNCPFTCGDNQVYEIRSECPKTCLNPNGASDCGIKRSVEGCYCKEGFLLDGRGHCVPASHCGCLLPDDSGVVAVGQHVISLDCTVVYSCAADGHKPIAASVDACGPNAVCTMQNNMATCVCRPGFYGSEGICTKDICANNPNPCGVGATCSNSNGTVSCSCPAGSSGDPKLRCSEDHITCSCLGDPHCSTFSKDVISFQGTCKYDAITTSCFNNTLGATLVPFNVRHKHSTNNWNNLAGKIATIRYVEINVFENQYRLMNTEFGDIPFTINGVRRNAPYFDDSLGLRIVKVGGQLAFFGKFGLTVFWDGAGKVVQTISSSYQSYVCGLCGSGIEANGVYLTRNQSIETNVFNWGQSWRVLDDAADSDKALCNPNAAPGTEQIVQLCAKKDMYEGQTWCGIMNDMNGPFKACISAMDSSYINKLVKACSFDMCASESNSEQSGLKCAHVQSFVEACYDYAESQNKTFDFTGWRDIVGCSVQCGANEFFGVKNSCPKSCTHANSTYCGILKPIEGCHCQDGYLRSSQGECIPFDECVCLLPDGTGYLAYGQHATSLDCSAVYSCERGSQFATVNPIGINCNVNAKCSIVNNQPACVCNPGYYGNGLNCSTTDQSDEATGANAPVLGCFADNQPFKNISRDLAFPVYKNEPANTYKKCSSACAAKNFLYAAVQNGTDCYCGNSYNGVGMSNNCNVSCSGDAGKVCGGFMANTVMRTSVQLNYDYMGCYSDSIYRDVPYLAYQHENNTIENCVSACSALGFSISALQNVRQCFCADKFGSQGLSSSCNMRCSGLPRQICGGLFANSIYKNKIVAAVTGPKPIAYLGCFQDRLFRDIPYSIYKGLNTSIDNCVDMCTSKNYLYAATQNGDTCYCGQSYGGAGLALNLYVCDMSCAANKEQICGGDFTNSIFETRAKKDFKYLGCWTDDSGKRDLSYLAYSDLSNKIEKCVKTCSDKGFFFAGVQDSSSCYCGNSYGSYGTAITCNSECKSDANQVCGGPSANSVFAIPPSTSGIKPVPTLGCFADDNIRDLPLMAYQDNKGNTLDRCRNTCAVNNFLYAGVQDGNKCFCGDSYGGQGKSNGCDKPCSGNPDMFCGGFFANTIMETLIENKLTFKYMGCFKDSAVRDITFMAYDDASNTIDRCVTKCNTEGFLYAALQEGKCFCGDSFGGQGPATICTGRCTGNKNQVCGGDYANTIYKTRF